MPPKFTVQLTGDTQLIAVFETLDVQIQRKALAPSFRKAANTVKQRAVQNAPMRGNTIARTIRTVGPLRTPSILSAGKRGPARLKKLQRIAQHFARLRNTFNVKALKRRRTRVGFSVWTGTRQQLGVSGKYYYPAHVEWGHRIRRRMGGGMRAGMVTTGRVRPYPYLGPAFHGHEAAILAQLAQDVRTGIQTITGIVVPP
jgi:hypothetical protein